MKYIFIILNIFFWCNANAQESPKNVYFTSGWCPRPEEIAEISEYLFLTMNGCCILQGSFRSTLGVVPTQLSRWKKRIIANFYPTARCDGVVITEAEESDQNQLMELKASADAAEVQKRKDEDRKSERWPPTSSDFCRRAAASGDLEQRGVSFHACIDLARTEGARAVSERAQVGGYFVREFGLWTVNSAGGVEPYAKFVNPNPREDIKYIDLQISMFNAVGDVVYSEIGSRATRAVRMVGPLGSDHGERSSQWKPIWYNHSAACLQIESVRVEFMNKTILNFSGKLLYKALHPALKNKCGVFQR